MTDELMSDDAKGGGEHDEGKRKFLQRWEEMGESERSTRALELWQAQRGETRKVTKLSERLTKLEAEREDGDTKAVASFEGLRDEIATVKAERALVGRQKAMLERAVKHEMDPALAVEFAATSDADRTFDLAVAEIERRVAREVTDRLTEHDTSLKAGVADLLDPDRFSTSEISRMPKAIQDKLFQKQVEKALR